MCQHFLHIRVELKSDHIGHVGPFLSLSIERRWQDVAGELVIVAQDKYRCFPALVYPLPAQLRAWVTLSEKANCLLSVFIHLYVQIWQEAHV